MKIATWNVNECVGITCNLDNQKTVDKVNFNNVDEIIEKLKENDFDVVCFQEYPILIDGEPKLTERILNETNLKYYEAYDTYDSYLFKGGRVGVAIFSKYEIKDSFKTLFGNPNMVKTSSSGAVYYSFDKPIIKVIISVDGEEYTIISGHAMAFAPFGKTEFDYPESYKPLEDLMMSCNGQNLIVLGDFNSEKLFEIMPSIHTKYNDVVDGATTKEYYEKRGEVQMDYILINNSLSFTDKFKVDNFSDHYIIGANIIKK